jgi:hypothetical protein
VLTRATMLLEGGIWSELGLLLGAAHDKECWMLVIVLRIVTIRAASVIYLFISVLSGYQALSLHAHIVNNDH